tara:strand:+ start:775 stop:1101 length:327 start_codon:yes stop_codon:yes gene_type:complete
MEDLLQPGATAGLVGVVMALIKLIEKQVAKRNGGTSYTRIVLLENEVSDLRADLKILIEKTNEFHRQFCEFREDVRLQWKADETRKETIRELRSVGNGNDKKAGLEDY